MQAPKEHLFEKERLNELESFSIMDTISESDYDDITAIAAEICGTHISLISLIDDKRQWFKSHHGLGASETPKEYAFCGHAINDQDNVFIIQDARTDERFHDNPLVTKDPHVIFYAGVPLVSDNGLPLGTLCVIDHEPKLLSQSQIKSLRALGKQVMHLLNLRKTKAALEKTLVDVEAKNIELERFAYMAAHDLKSPLIGISSLSHLLSEKYLDQLDNSGKHMLNLIAKSSEKLTDLINGLLEYSKHENILQEQKSEINLADLTKEITDLFSHEPDLRLTLKSPIKDIVTNKAALDKVLINLITNSIKYNDKEKVEIELEVSSSDTHYKMSVLDNGPGIAPEHHEKIFGIFEVVAEKDKFGTRGNGIGLASVKKLLENSGGSIKVNSKLQEGAKFTFTLQK